jgi:hypothetical protein
MICYGIFAFIKYSEAGPQINDLSAWATAMLIFIAISVGVVILTQILFHIGIVAGFEIKKQVTHEINRKIKEQMPSTDLRALDSDLELDDSEFEVVDEMEKIISLKANKAGYIVTGVGFVLALLTLAIKLPPSIMLNIIFFSFVIASIVENIVHLYFYKRGI